MLNSGTETASALPKLPATSGAPPNSWDVIASTTSATSAPPAISAAASCQTGVSRDGSSAAPPR